MLIYLFVKWNVFYNAKWYFLSGFLLGKFVSDRQHLINKMKMEREANPIKNLETAINLLIPEATNLTRQQMSVLHPDSNTKVWSQWQACYQFPGNVDYDKKPVDFVQSLIFGHIRQLTKCFHDLAFMLMHFDEV